MQLLVLGTGETHYEKALHAAAESYGGRMSVKNTYDEALAHRIQAGADVMLMPSRFEPLWFDTIVQYALWHYSGSA